MNFEEIYKNMPKPHIPAKLPVELSSILYTIKARSILDRYNEFKDICVSKMSSKYSIMLLDEIFKKPAFKAKQLQDIIPGSKATLYNMLDEFVSKGILQKDKRVRNTTYFCPAILTLL